MMRKIDTVLFDWSGTIIDDLHVTWKAIAKTLLHYNLGTLSLRQFRHDFCAPYWNFFIKRGLDKKASKHETPVIFKSFYMDSAVQLFPEVVSTLDYLKSKNVKIGLVSQTPRALINKTLERFSISSYFDVIVALEDCKSQKPSPEPILNAMNMIDSQRNHTIYVGDMKEDILAARNAGVFSIAICRNCSYHDKKTVLFENPDMIIQNLSEISKIISSSNQSTLLLPKRKRH